MSDLKVQTVAHPDGTVIVQLAGHADIAGAGVLERNLTFLSAKHPKHVIFDLSAVEFISSLAMGVIMQFRRGCTTWGGRVTLAAAQAMVFAAFKHAGLHALLPMTETVAAALASEGATQVTP